MQEDKVLEAKDAALLVSTCITRTLPPALTLEQGLDSIEEAVEEFKSKRPCSTGMLTFQVNFKIDTFFFLFNVLMF